MPLPICMPASAKGPEKGSSTPTLTVSPARADGVRRMSAAAASARITTVTPTAKHILPGLQRYRQQRVDAPAIEDHELFHKQRRGPAEVDAVDVAPGAEQHRRAVIHDAHDHVVRLRRDDAAIVADDHRRRDEG